MKTVDPNLAFSPPGDRRAMATKKTEKKSPPRPGLIQRKFWWLAAVDSRVMSHPDCSADWRRYAILGAAVAVIGVLAALYGMTVVFFYYLRDARVAAACGVIWGGIIVVTDRLMLAYTVKAPNTRVSALALMAIPRLILAILIAVAISVPAELVLFSRQIEKQLAIQHTAEVVAQRHRLDQRYAEIPQLDSLEQTLQGEIAAKDAAAAAQFAQAACEADGTCGSGQSGDGFRYREQLARYDKLKAEADGERVANKRRIETLRARRDSLWRERNLELAAFRAVTDAADDLLSRMTALEQLEQDPTVGRSVWLASWVIRLLAILIDILPLGAKLNSRRGPYEAAYLAVHDGQRARWDARREAALYRAAVEQDRREAIADGVRKTTRRMVEQATAEALTSHAARKALRDLQRQILDPSVKVARRAAARVFAGDELEREIAEAGRAHRRRADERIVDAEARKADIVRDLDRATAEADEVLGEQQDFTNTEWPQPERREAHAGAAD